MVDTNIPSGPLTLETHDRKSDMRAQDVKQYVHECFEYMEDKMGEKLDHIQKKLTHRGDKEMSEGINTDKVVVNAGGGGEGAGNMAAVIAALGNRNQGNDNAALIAALGNRNDDSANWVGPLMAMANRGPGYGYDGGFGGNALWPIILLALLGRRGGFGGGGDDCCDNDRGRTAILQTLMEGQSDIRAQVPTTALQTQAELQSTLSSLALGIQQGLANNKDALQAALLAILQANATTKDVVQNGFAVTNSNIIEGTCKVKDTIRDDGDKTRGQIALYHEANLQRELAVAQNALTEERHSRRVRDVEVSVQQTVNQNQAQAQQQAQWQQQFDFLRNHLAFIGNQVVANKQGQDIVNLGTMLGSATQAAANTAVK